MIVVDTSALLAILNNEPERDHCLDILANDDRPMLSAVTLYETMLVVGARRGRDNLGDLASILATIEAEIVPFDADQARASQAVYMRYGKGIHPAASLNLCDCVAYALAKQLGVPLLFKGADFKATDIVAAVDHDATPLPIHWLGSSALGARPSHPESRMLAVRPPKKRVWFCWRAERPTDKPLEEPDRGRLRAAVCHVAFDGGLA